MGVSKRLYLSDHKIHHSVRKGQGERLKSVKIIPLWNPTQYQASVFSIKRQCAVWAHFISLCNPFQVYPYHSPSYSGSETKTNARLLFCKIRRIAGNSADHERRRERVSVGEKTERMQALALWYPLRNDRASEKKRKKKKKGEWRRRNVR